MGSQFDGNFSLLDLVSIENQFGVLDWAQNGMYKSDFWYLSISSCLEVRMGQFLQYKSNSNLYQNGILMLLNMNLKLGMNHQVLNISKRGKLLQEDGYCQLKQEYISPIF